jgi:hypothetical protein
MLLKINQCTPNLTSIQGNIQLDLINPTTEAILYTNTTAVPTPTDTVTITIPASTTATWTLDKYCLKVTYTDGAGVVSTLTCIDLRMENC